MISLLMKLSPVLVWGLGIGLVLFLAVLLRNLKTGAFSPLKFISGFNLFLPGVQGKLIYIGVILIVAAILLFGLYHQLTRATYDTNYKNNYKNNIHGNNAVTVDQRQIISQPEDTLMIGVKVLGLKVGISAQSKPAVPITVIDNTKVQKKAKKKTTLVGTTFKVVTFPIKLLWGVAKKVI